MLWLRRDIAVNHPFAIDKMLVATGLCKSLTEARRQIAAGGIYLNNEKLVPPEEGFLPIIIPEEGIPLAEFIALGITEELAEKILSEPESSACSSPENTNDTETASTSQPDPEHHGTGEQPG